MTYDFVKLPRSNFMLYSSVSKCVIIVDRGGGESSPSTWGSSVAD